MTGKLIQIFFFLLLSGTSLAQKEITLRVDPDNAHGGTASGIFDSIRFIPLETTRESLFGSIDQLEVTDSLFIILDIRGRSIVLFRRSGKFFTKLTTGGPGKYYYCFTVDRVRNEIIVYNNYADGLLVYDYNGKFLRKEVCPEELISFYRLPGGTVIYNPRRPALTENSNKIQYDLLYSDGYDHVVRSLKPYNCKYEDGEFNMMSNPFNFSGQSGSCMFSLPFEYAVYQLNDTGILRKYQFIFPKKYSLPVNFEFDSSYRNKRAQYAYGNPLNFERISGLMKVYRLGDNLLFSATSYRSTIGSDWNYVYNLKNSALISFSKVTGDSASAYFPILSSVLEQVDAVSDNYIYSSMASFRMLAFKSGMEEKVAYPEVLQKYFATAKKMDNPIIIQFKLKPNL